MKHPRGSVLAKPNASRRRFVAAVSAAIGGVSVIDLLPCKAVADELPHLSPNDPLAKALTYTEDASTTTAATHAPGSACANCNFFQGGSGAFGACQLFPGETVNAKGWCAGYVKKS
jgi:High potential iron-sulfur protein